LIPLLGESDIAITDPDPDVIKVIHSLKVRVIKNSKVGIRWGIRVDIKCFCGEDNITRDKKSTMMNRDDWTVKKAIQTVFDEIKTKHKDCLVKVGEKRRHETGVMAQTRIFGAPSEKKRQKIGDLKAEVKNYKAVAAHQKATILNQTMKIKAYERNRKSVNRDAYNPKALNMSNPGFDGDNARNQRHKACVTGYNQIYNSCGGDYIKMKDVIESIRDKILKNSPKDEANSKHIETCVLIVDNIKKGVAMLKSGSVTDDVNNQLHVTYAMVADKLADSKK